MQHSGKIDKLSLKSLKSFVINLNYVLFDFIHLIMILLWLENIRLTYVH